MSILSKWLRVVRREILNTKDYTVFALDLKDLRKLTSIWSNVRKYDLLYYLL